jgi:hypothetical protein
MAAYAEQLVEAGKADSVSAVFNDAMHAQRERDRLALAQLKETAAKADPARVARMRAHVDAQLAAIPR